MAADDADKTEEPTGKKVTDSRKKGMVGKSMDLNSSLVVLAGSILIWLFADHLVGGMRNTMVESFRAIGNFEEIPGMIFSLARQGFLGLLYLIFPIALGITIVSLIVNLGQVGFLWTLTPLGPNFGKVFGLAGFKKLFSAASFVEVFKSVAKMAIVGMVAYMTVAAHYDEYLALPDMDLSQFCHLLFSVSLEVLIKSTLVLFLVGVADLAYQKQKLHKELKMTKTEVKDEARQSDGDPYIKGKIKGMRQQMHRNFMMQELPKATVIITNPTFIAIAVRYEQGQDAAPVVVAKGKRLIAERIRDFATGKGIPIVEDKPLARGLYDIAQPGDQIPEEFFAAVAEILAYVYSLKGQPAV